MQFIPGPVLLIGPPGVGKGTQAKLLMAEFGIPQVSTGDLFRQHRREHTELGLIADKLMELGQLVPDDLVNKMVAVRLASPDCARGYILDGFPRTLAQANWLDGYLTETAARLPVVVDVYKRQPLGRCGAPRQDSVRDGGCCAGHRQGGDAAGGPQTSVEDSLYHAPRREGSRRRQVGGILEFVTKEELYGT